MVGPLGPRGRGRVRAHRPRQSKILPVALPSGVGTARVEALHAWPYVTRTMPSFPTSTFYLAAVTAPYTAST